MDGWLLVSLMIRDQPDVGCHESAMKIPDTQGSLGNYEVLLFFAHMGRAEITEDNPSLFCMADLSIVIIL